MTTLHNTVKTYLLADVDVIASPCSTRIYIDNWLPDGYTIQDGPILIFAPRGGPGTDAYFIENQTMVFRSFASTISDAFSIDNALFTALRKTHNPANASVFYAKDIVSPTLSREPGGLYVVSSSFGVSEVI
jgi:hypothetical protein